jgi:hypothetical protein
MCTGWCPCDGKHKDLFKEKTKDGFKFTVDPDQYRVPEYADAYLNEAEKKELLGEQFGNA